MGKTISVVGLDIGATGIRGVQVSPKNDGTFQIERAGSVPLPHGVVSEGYVQDKNILAEALKALWREAKFTTETVKIGVGSESMNAFTGEVDWAPDADMKTLLPYSEIVKAALIDNADQYYLNYHTISEYTKTVPSPTDPDERIRKRFKYILVGGGPKTNIDALIEACLAAKLKPVSVDVYPLALIRAYNGQFFNETFDSINASIDIGADSITIVLHKSGQPLYVRSVVGVSGNKITDEITENTGVLREKAEQRKIEAFDAPEEVFATSEPRYASVFSDDQENTAEETDANYRNRVQKIKPYVIEGIANISNVIQRTLDHFLQLNVGQELGQLSGIYLSGGMAYAQGVATRLEAEFETPVVASVPLGDANIPFSGHVAKERQAEYTVAYGLAIGRNA